MWIGNVYNNIIYQLEYSNKRLVIFDKNVIYFIVGMCVCVCVCMYNYLC